jgi:hypothetical protein
MNQIQSKWRAVKDVLLEGLPSAKRRTMNVVLENTLKDSARLAMSSPQQLFENASSGATSTGNIAMLNRVILPVLRRVMPGVIANELVGVQPMDGPVGQIYTLKVNYAQGNIAGSVAGDEVFAPRHIRDLAVAYSGNENASSPAAAETIALEGVPGNAVNIEVVKEVVLAKSRRLSARWTIEAQQDANAMVGIDIESELMAAIAQQITLDIDQEILRRLRSLPPTPTAQNTYDQGGVSGQATFVGDEFAALAIMINKEANDIATRTRKAPGNWIVVSPTALTILQSARSSAFARTTEGDLEGPTNTKLVGTLNSALKVYCDTYATSSTSILVGWKGDSEVEAGCYYCPYVPLTSTPVMWDPQTYEPNVGFMTRYGWLELTNKATSFGNSADFYGLVGINSSTLSFF